MVVLAQKIRVAPPEFISTVGSPLTLKEKPTKALSPHNINKNIAPFI